MRDADARSLVPEPGVVRRMMATGPNLMIVEHRFEAGWKGAPHAHPHEQLVYVTSGRLKFRAGDDAFEVGPGDTFVVPGDVEHEAEALEASVALDVFTPIREDYA